MDQIGRVNIIDGAQHIVHDYSQMIHVHLQPLVLLEHLVQIGLLDVHDEENVVNRIWRAFVNIRDDHIENVGGKTVALQRRELSHNLYLANDFLGLVVSLEHVFQ